MMLLSVWLGKCAQQNNTETKVIKCSSAVGE